MTRLRVLINSRTLAGFALPDFTFGPAASGTLAWDYSETLTPWAGSPSEWEARMPSGVPVVDLGSGATFWDALNNTVNAQSGRHIIRLPAGRHMLTSFRLIGSSGDPLYSFGFWFPKVAGFVGPGAAQCSIEMAAGSMSQTQMDALNARPYDFNPIQIGLCRIDASASDPGFIGGVSFRAADQQNITNKADAAQTFELPTPAPHQGVVLYGAGPFTVSHVRFQAAGRALMGRPPFEMANATTQYSSVEWFNTEFDGRRASEIDPNQPRRCGPWMGNNENLSRMTNCYLHDCNESRYAANDENRNTFGLYELTRTKIAGNVASNAGWESSSATIKVTDCIMSQDSTRNTYIQHLNLTSVGARNPQGGRMVVRGGVWRTPVYPQIDGYLTARIISNTYWMLDGLATTVEAYSESGVRLTPWTTTSWPPTAAQLSAAGLSPSTHYLVRTN